MRYLRFIIPVVTGFTLLSCAKAEINPVQKESGRRQETGNSFEIISTAEDFMVGNYDMTKIEISQSADNAPDFSWKEGDEIGVVPLDGKTLQTNFEIKQLGSNSKCALFDGGDWALKEDGRYLAYYPYQAFAYNSNASVSFSFENQFQVEDNSLAHLGNYDYMYASSVSPVDGKLTFAFKHFVSLLRIRVKVPCPGTFVRASIVADSEAFAAKATLKLSDGTVVASELSSSITLGLDNIEVDTGETLTLWVAVLPSAAIAAKIPEFYLYRADGTFLKGSFSSACVEFKSGFAYSYNVDEIADETVGSKEAIENCILECYKAFYTWGLSTSHLDYLQPASGITHFGLIFNDDAHLSQLRFAKYSNDSVMRGSMMLLYKTVYACNSLLIRLQFSTVDSSYLQESVAEVRFIRACAYFWLVRMFGDVPLQKDIPYTQTNTTGKRAPWEKVMAFILDDLGYAECTMRDFDKVAQMAGLSSGRCCNLAATSMKSLVYLTIGTMLAHSEDNFWDNGKRCPDFSDSSIYTAKDAFTMALGAAEKVIAAEKFQLETKYGNLFRWTDKKDWESLERIIAIPVRKMYEMGVGSQLARSTLPRHIYDTVDNVNAGRLRPSRWFFQTWCGEYGGVKGTGRTSGIYVDCRDPRLPDSFFYGSYPSSLYGGEYRIYPSINTTSGQGAFPYIKKYYDPSFDVNNGMADFYVMRYAEVILIAAEACANLSSGPGDADWNKAMAYVEQIHARARHSVADGQPDSDQPRWGSDRFHSKEELINGIFWERCFELNSEEHEYFDTHRMGAEWLFRNIYSPKCYFLNLPEQNGENNSFKDTFYGSSFIEGLNKEDLRKSLLCAFPYEELMANPDLSVYDQNDFYWQ